jgi:cephalosporin hydroxylase
MIIDKRLEDLKNYPRATTSYIFTVFEFALEFKPKKILSLGVQNGAFDKTMLLALKENNSGILVSVDHKDRSTILDAEYQDVKPFWNFIEGNTHDEKTLENVKSYLEEGELFDMLMVDAGHSEDDFRQDMKMYFPLVRKGGIILCHDSVNYDAGVRNVIPEITDEKFNIDWGKSRRRDLVPGLCIIKKS